MSEPHHYELATALYRKLMDEGLQGMTQVMLSSEEDEHASLLIEYGLNWFELIVTDAE